jgi:hypothetical protein
MNFSLKNAKKSFAPIDFSVVYLVHIRLRTSIYTGFTSFGAGQVKRNFQYGKPKFCPSKRKKPRFLQLAFLYYILYRQDLGRRYIPDILHLEEVK